MTDKNDPDFQWASEHGGNRTCAKLLCKRPIGAAIAALERDTKDEHLGNCYFSAVHRFGFEELIVHSSVIDEDDFVQIAHWRFETAISRSVINQDDFFVDPSLCEHAFDRLRDPALGVETWNQNRDERFHRTKLEARVLFATRAIKTE